MKKNRKDLAKPRCSKCKKIKSSDEFRLRKYSPGRKCKGTYLCSWCKKCERRYWRESSASRFSRSAHRLKRKYKGNITSADLKKLGDPDICYLCGDKIEIGDAEYDHVIPRAAGGILCPENIRWTHRKCNRIKHDLTLKKLVILLRKILNKIG